MKRNRQAIFSKIHNNLLYKRRITSHEAGHAVAINAHNKNKNLPPIFYQITFQDTLPAKQNKQTLGFEAAQDYDAVVNGGRLIKKLPESLNVSVANDDLISNEEHLCSDFLTAFEADVVHLLIGPLAEAKHVALLDDEVFNKYLISLEALHNYGGSPDLAVIEDYLACYSDSKHLQKQKLTELFIQAFDFIDNESNWEKIMHLSEYFINNNVKTINHTEINTVLN